jgi:hypothetical protein
MIIIDNFLKKYNKTIISIFGIIILFTVLYFGNIKIEKIELSIAILTLSSLILNFFNMDKDKIIQKEIKKYEKSWKDSNDIKIKKEKLLSNRSDTIEEIKKYSNRYKSLIKVDMEEGIENKDTEISINSSAIENLQKINSNVSIYGSVLNREIVVLSQEIKEIIDSKDIVTLKELQIINKNVDEILIHLNIL